MSGILPTLVGFRGFTGVNADPTIPLNFSIDIPTAAHTEGTLPGAEAGDLLVASILTWQSILAPGRGLAELVKVEGAGTWAYGVWAGIWDGDTTALAWQGTGWNNATGQYFGAFLAAFRNHLDPSRPPSTTYAPTVGGLPGSGPALSVNWVRAGFTGVGGLHPYDGTDWFVPANGFINASYALGTVALHADAVADQTTTDSSASGAWPYIAFGLDPAAVAPPCRLHPREDELGVGSGRIWPPPRSQQFSPRRAGGYY